MSTALVAVAASPRMSGKAWAVKGLLLGGGAGFTEATVVDLTAVMPVSAGTGAPNHNALKVGELYCRLDSSSWADAWYRATDLVGTWVAQGVLGPVSSPMTAAQDISGNGQTISLPTTGINKAISSGAARTGTILAAGTVAGQLIILENTNVSGGDTITFDATPATSRVAQGTHAIVAGTAKMYTWNATASLWYPVG